MSGCLNEYHLQFLQLLVRRGARFLIIGGQARTVHHGTRTRDLDLWVDISADHVAASEQCVNAWSAKHPVHALLPIPVQLAPNQQIKFPDADAWFIGTGGEPKEIGPPDGIDILTSVGSADFAAHFDRADWRQTAGTRLPFLGLVDLDAISPAKSKP